MVAALVRSSTWATRPPVPVASMNPVCHRSQASTRRFVCGPWVQIGPEHGHRRQRRRHRGPGRGP